MATKFKEKIKKEKENVKKLQEEISEVKNKEPVGNKSDDKDT
jgi:DNA-binding transcriptional regulator GbsR (MarR family)